MRGLGRVFRRGSVYWIAYYYRGKEYRESSESESEAKARKLLKKRLGEMGRGRLIGPSEEKVTFKHMGEDLIRDYETNSKRSVASAKLSLAHLRMFFGLDRALDITTDRVRAYVANRQEQKASNGSINRELSALKRMFSLAVQAAKLSSKPYIAMLEENNARQGFVDYGTFLQVREALPDYLKDPVTFLYLSGWRVSEMRALEWRDIDWAGKVVSLRPEISKNKDGRLLPMKDELLEIIERAKQRRLLSCPHVFHTEGQGIGDFRKAWQSGCVAVGLGQFVAETDQSEASTGAVDRSQINRRKRKRKKYRGLIVHDLRRSAIRNMLRAGIHERVAMRLSGHKTRSVFDRYNIVNESDLRDAADKLQIHLNSQSKTAVVSAIRGNGK